MKNKIYINGKQYELLYTLHAAEQIEDAIGEDAKSISTWLKGPYKLIMKRVVQIIVILVNAKIERDNVNRKAGILTGEPQNPIEEELIYANMTPGDIMMHRSTVLGAITEGLRINLPEEAERQRDYDLEEIEEKNG